MLIMAEQLGLVSIMACISSKELLSLYLEIGELELEVYSEDAIELENVMIHELFEDLPSEQPWHLIRKSFVVSIWCLSYKILFLLTGCDLLWILTIDWL